MATKKKNRIRVVTPSSAEPETTFQQRSVAPPDDDYQPAATKPAEPESARPADPAPAPLNPPLAPPKSSARQRVGATRFVTTQPPAQRQAEEEPSSRDRVIAQNRDAEAEAEAEAETSL